MTTQVVFGKPVFGKGSSVVQPRAAEAIAESGTSAASSNSALTGEWAEVTATADIWATVSGTAASGTTLLIPAGATKWFPALAEGDTISVITA